MKRMIKISICSAIIFMIILFGIKIEKYLHKNYITRDIFGCIDYIYHYEEMIREKSGEYKEKFVYAENGDERWLVYCDDIKVVYWYDMEEKKVGDFMYAQVDDGKYVFGEKGLRVGMNKEIVEKILKYSKIATPNPDSKRVFDNEGTLHFQSGTIYFDDTYWNGMGIFYDEENNVEKILIFKGM